MTDTFRIRTDPFCVLPFHRLRVSCEGDTYFCCFQRGRPLGNLCESSLEEIWFGDLAEEVRRSTLRGALHEFCLVDNCPELHRPLYAAEPRKTQYPKVLEIDLPDDHCNIGGRNPGDKSRACIMCDRDDPEYELKRSTAIYDVLPRLRPLVPHLNAMHIQGLAEAFWQDALFRVLDLLDFDRYREQILVCTYTNGILLNRKVRQRFFERCPKSYVSFSLDAGSPETYTKIRRVKAYPLVLNNLIEYARERKAYPGAGLQIHNNINLLNLHEVTTMVRVAAEAEVDLLQFCATVGNNPKEIQVNAENAHLFLEAQHAITEEARRLGVPLKFLRPLDEGLSKKGFQSVVVKSARMMGFVDGIAGGTLLGWARDPKRGNEALEIVVFNKGKKIASAVANEYRADLEKYGGDGRHAFSIPLPVHEIAPGDRLTVRVPNPIFELARSPLEYRLEKHFLPEGRLDCMDSGVVGGWVWDPAKPARKFDIEISVTGPGVHKTWTAKADRQREDLTEHGIGDGRYGFSLELPVRELPRNGCKLSVRAPELGLELRGSPLEYRYEKPFLPEGHLEAVLSDRVEGWAWDPDAPGKRVEIEVSVNGPDQTHTHVVVADRFRADLAQGGIGDGSHAFVAELPAGILGRATSVSARVREPKIELFNSPLAPARPAAPPPSA